MAGGSTKMTSIAPITQNPPSSNHFISLFFKNCKVRWKLDGIDGIDFRTFRQKCWLRCEKSLRVLPFWLDSLTWIVAEWLSSRNWAWYSHFSFSTVSFQLWCAKKKKKMACYHICIITTRTGVGNWAHLNMGFWKVIRFFRWVIELLNIIPCEANLRQQTKFTFQKKKKKNWTGEKASKNWLSDWTKLKLE